MVNRVVGRSLRVGALAVVFSAGFLCGSVTHRNADAQLKELGDAAMKQAGGSGGAVGSAVQLGGAIVDMQQHLDALQKNMDVLKKVKAALGG